MSRGVLTTICVYAIGILVVVGGFFLLDIEKVAITFWAFGSLVFSLVISLVAMISLVASKGNKNAIFYNAGLGCTIWIYEIAVIISVLFTKYFVDKLNTFIFLQITINALFFIIATIIIVLSGVVYNNNSKTYESLRNGEYNKAKRGRF